VSPDLEHALQLAYRYLNRRERTTHEVRGELQRSGIEAALAQQTVTMLTEQGYLDDARFTRLFVQDKRELDEWGGERIRQALLARGVDPELSAAVLADAPTNAELDRALRLLKRRFPTPPRDRRERDRALGVLIRKGFEPELALDALAAHARAQS
jgi:regulatory protein